MANELNLKGLKVKESTTSGSFIKTGGTDSQFLKADGSVDNSTYITSITNITEIPNRSYNDLQDLPIINSKGFSFSPMKVLNTDFLVYASAIVRPTNSFVENDLITWEILDDVDHGGLFFKSAEGLVDQGLKINHPTVKRVISSTVAPDETFASNGVVAGASVGLNSMNIKATQRAIAPGVRITGDGAGGWIKSTNGNYINLSTFSSTSGTQLGPINDTDGGLDFPFFYRDGVNLAYVGKNNYRIRQEFSGIGAGYAVKFFLVDIDTNTDVTINPTADDVILVQNIGTLNQVVNLYRYKANTNGFMGTFTNFWVSAVYEAWLIASPVSESGVVLKWQDYPNATEYKLYRDTNKDFSTMSLVYQGTDKTFSDSGLLSDTVYYYKLYGVVSSVDTEISEYTATTL